MRGTQGLSCCPGHSSGLFWPIRRLSSGGARMRFGWPGPGGSGLPGGDPAGEEQGDQRQERQGRERGAQAVQASLLVLIQDSLRLRPISEPTLPPGIISIAITSV